MLESNSAEPSLKLFFPLYAALLGLTIMGFLGISYVGEHYFHSSQAVLREVSDVLHKEHFNVVVHVLATLAAVVGVGAFFSWLLGKCGQPAVIGEVIAGIVLGPSLLGQISPWLMHLLIPGTDVDPSRFVLTALNAIAQLGVILYMFLVGMELNLDKAGRMARTALMISHASIVVPFLCGALLSVGLYTYYSGEGVSFTIFSMFMGVAMSITAFPVLSRILVDRGLAKTDLGVMALSCAAMDDVTAWCLLAFIVGIAESQTRSVAMILATTLAFVFAMFQIVQPLLKRWLARNVESESLTVGVASAILIGLLISAIATEAIGIHAIFGAFLFGAVIPHDSPVAIKMAQQLKMIVLLVLMPAFFAITGMNTQIGLIHGASQWLICLAIIAVATIGKFGGTYVAAKFMGLNRTTAAALGLLMNTRGLMELVVLNIGLSLGVISPRLFSMMVLMALATTMLTGPLLTKLVPTTR